MPTLESSLRDGFLKQVALRPDAPALVVKGRAFSYGELDKTARRWAGAITSRLGGPATRVGVFGSRSEVSYTAALAALYSGAAFVPLNPRFPADRTRAMISRAELDAMFVDKLASTHLAAVLDGLEAPPPIWFPEEEESASELSGARPLDRRIATPSARACGVSIVHLRQYGRAQRRADFALERSRIHRLGGEPVWNSAGRPLLADL